MSLLRRLFTRPAPDVRDSRDADSASRGTAKVVPVVHPAEERVAIVDRAAALAAAGRFGESLAMVERARRQAPDDPQLAFARASIFFAWGRLHEARDAGIRAEALGLRCTALYLHLGWSCYRMGNLAEAEAWLRKALALEPEGFQPLLNLAVVLQAQKRTAEAAAHYERLLAVAPDDFDALMGSGICRLDQADRTGAEALFRRAVGVSGENPEAWAHVGAALGHQGRDDEARAFFERSVELEAENPVNGDGFINLAINLRDVGRTAEALDLFERNLERRPDVLAHLSYAHALLKAGRFSEGWRQYEFRWLDVPLLPLRPHFDRPVWAGQDLRGRTILLRGEQGLGDTIQFLRYAPQVKALGATVLVRAQAELTSLLRGFPGVDHLLEVGESNPDFDFYIPLLSLPRVFGTDLASIPADVPYLHPEPARLERWAPKLGPEGPLKVGIVWAGNPKHMNDRYRSIGLDVLAPLLELEGVRFISLQKGQVLESLESFARGLELVNLGPELHDFCDTAAVIAQLDLVICVDTAVAHLAGALGKPVWIMLAQPPDFRWLEERDDSPWYPTARLFRERRRGDWRTVVERVKAALQQRLKSPNARAVAGATRIPTSQPITARPQLPALAPLSGVGGRLSCVAETRLGILQYFPDQDPVGRSIEWYGEYLQPQLDLLAQFVRPGATVMEVGADVGMHALFLASAVGSAGHVFLYEPRPVVQQVLRSNLGANDVTNVTVMRSGLGRVANSGSDAPKTGVSLRERIPAESMSPGRTTETLDELLLERLDWLKINGSVGALDVLDGGASTLWRLRPWLFVAVPHRSALGGLASRVKEFGYRCWCMETPLFNPANFNRRDGDIFSGGTALALLAVPEEIEADVALDGCIELS